MELLFEKSHAGRGCDLLPPLDVPPAHLMEGTERRTPLRLHPTKRYPQRRRECRLVHA